MEDLPVKAIVIGVSLFVTMMVLSTIIIYFNTARGIADTVSNRADIADNFDYIMNSDDFSDVLTGVEVRSLINKYAANKSVEINILSIGGLTTEEYKNVNNSWLVSVKWNSVQISEEKLDIINPVWKNRVEKVNTSNKTVLNISLNV